MSKVPKAFFLEHSLAVGTHTKFLLLMGRALPYNQVLKNQPCFASNEHCFLLEELLGKLCNERFFLT